MTKKELIKALEKFPDNAEVRFATPKNHKGERTLISINAAENYCGWVLLKNVER